MSLSGMYFFYTGPGSTEKRFFLAGSAFEPFSPQTIITPHYSTNHFSLNQHKHIIMANQLPLAELSIQNKIRQHDETMQPIKTKKIHPSNSPRLRHLCSLNTLPSPTNKWSAMTHPLRATVMGFNGMTISYGHYYFHHDHVLLTHAYTTSTTATTVGDGGNPRGSTELNDKSGHKCCLTDAEFLIFAHLVLGLDSAHNSIGTGSKGHKQRDRSYVNMLLTDYATITNLHPFPFIHNKIANNQQALACALACCTLLLLGSDALTPLIIQRVWGANDTIRTTLGRPRGDLALIRRHLISLSKIAINTYHLWATIDFDNVRIINDNALRCHPPGLQSINRSLQDPTTAEYVRAPLAPGTTRINSLLMNLRQDTIDLSPITFEDAIVSWYSDLLLDGRSATDTTGIENGIFRVFGVASSTNHYT